MKTKYLAAITVMLFAGAAAAVPVDSVVKALQTGSPAERLEARQQAAALGAEAVAPIADVADSDDYETSKSAREALAAIAHHAARPGAREEQQAVAAALAELLKGDPSEPLARTVLELLGYIGTRGSIAPVAAYLEEPGLADAALTALQRIPGRTVTQTLAGALPAADAPLAAQIAYALGERDDEAAIPALAVAARREDPGVALAAVRALSKLGAIEAEALARTLHAPPHRQAGLAALDAAEALTQQGKDAAATRIYVAAARSQTAPPIIIGALTGLNKLDYPKFAEVALSFAGEPAIRPTAIKLLQESSEPGLDAKLAQMAHNEDAPSWTRSAAVEVLDARDAPQTEGAIDALAASGSPALRVLAAQLRGEAAALEDIAHVAAHGPAWRQSEALAIFMRNAGALAGSGDDDRARKLLADFIGSPAPAWAKGEALEMLAPIATAEDLPAIEGLRAEEELAGRAEVAALRLSTADAPREEAVATLEEALANTEYPEVTAFALTRLQELGEDTRAALKARGYLVDWSLLGPFPNEDQSAFGKDFIDPQQVEGQGPVTVDGTVYEWKQAAATGLPAVVNLKQWLYPNTNTAAYAYARIELDEARKAVLELGTDDGCEVWVNGERVHTVPQPRSMTPADDKIRLSLPAGTSEMLLKVLQGSADWQFCARLVTQDGKPIDLR